MDQDTWGSRQIDTTDKRANFIHVDVGIFDTMKQVYNEARYIMIP